jgi:TatD DNase family protein
MYIDIHRHSSDSGKADLVLRNLFHNQTDQVSHTPFCSVGLHPWHILENLIKSDVKLIQAASGFKNVLAIGETGLDKAVTVDLEFQREVFLSQIEIAKMVNKPLVIHCVRAYDELLSFRKNANHNQPWIFHWFNAAPQTAFDLINKGCYLSFGHMLFKEESKAFKSFLQIPLQSVFLETDDIDVSIIEVYERAARLKNISVGFLQNQIEANFNNCFGIHL